MGNKKYHSKPQTWNCQTSIRTGCSMPSGKSLRTRPKMCLVIHKASKTGCFPCLCSSLSMIGFKDFFWWSIYDYVYIYIHI